MTYKRIALVEMSKPVKIKILLVFLIGGITYVVVLACLYETIYPIVFQPVQPVAEGDFPDQPVWIFEASEQVTSTPLVYNSRIFIRTLDAIYALDSRSGNALWDVKSPAQGKLSPSPAASGNMLAVPESETRILALSVQNGDLKWKDGPYETRGDPLYYSVQDVIIEFESVFVARLNWLLTASELDNGSLIWEKEVPGRSSLSLTLGPGVVYIAGGATLEAYETRNGTLLYRRVFNDSIGSTLYDEGMLFVTFPYGNYNLMAFDSQDLSEVWKIQSPELRNSKLRTLSINGSVIFAGGERLYAISKSNGNLLWKTERTGDLETAVVLDNQVFVRNRSTTLYAFDIHSGAEIGRLLIRRNSPLRYDLERGPAVADGLLIVPFGDNRVYAYQP